MGCQTASLLEHGVRAFVPAVDTAEAVAYMIADEPVGAVPVQVVFVRAASSDGLVLSLRLSADSNLD